MMDLLDLKKLESVPPGSEYMFRFSGCKNMEEMQMFSGQVDFDFAVPKLDKCDHKLHIWSENGKMYLYLVMKKLFGSPETFEIGLSSLTRYILTSGSSLFMVSFIDNGESGPSLCILSAVGEKGNLNDQFSKLKKALDREINKFKSTQKLASHSVPRTYFENPFHFYFQQGQRQLDVISKHNAQVFDKIDIEHGIYKLKKDLKLIESDDSNRDENRKAKIRRDIIGLEAELDDLELYGGALDDRLSETAAFFLFVASFEGFLNLFYEIYLRRELREDDRIKDYIKRSHIDIKLRTMPVYCSCFKDKDRLIEPDETFNKIQAIFNLRNDLIHANMTSAMKVELYDIDNITFYAPEKNNKSPKHDLPQTAASLTAENLRFISGTVEKMVEQIIASMEPQYNREFKQVLHQDGFYVRLVDGEYVIEVDKI